MRAQSPLIIGNWKLNGNSKAFCHSFANQLRKIFHAPISQVDIAICPQSLFINDLHNHLSVFNIHIGTQNVSEFITGSYTGEISAASLAEFGCSLAIIGHSERRKLFDEKNIVCNKKIKNVQEQSILPVLCIGESKNERIANVTNEVLSKQLIESLTGISVTTEKPLCIAYEPIWAIGSGESASPFVAQKAHRHIRLELTKLYGENIANNIKVLYGGSVDKANAQILLEQPDINGLLIGGASLDPEQFTSICYTASSVSSIEVPAQ